MTQQEVIEHLKTQLNFVSRRCNDLERSNEALRNLNHNLNIDICWIRKILTDIENKSTKAVQLLEADGNNEYFINSYEEKTAKKENEEQKS